MTERTGKLIAFYLFLNLMAILLIVFLLALGQDYSGDVQKMTESVTKIDRRLQVIEGTMVDKATLAPFAMPTFDIYVGNGTEL